MRPERLRHYNHGTLKGWQIAIDLPQDVQKVFENAETKGTPAEWALRWVWNHPEVSSLLSGMNTMEQVVENIKVAGNAKANSLTEEELEVIEKVKKTFKERIKVDCTSCSYCMPCPAGVNIPSCFTSYNNYHMFGREESYNRLAAEQRASNCAECGECETHCPQGIPIREELKKVRDLYE